jgi:hypothetical protein
VAQETSAVATSLGVVEHELARPALDLGVMVQADRPSERRGPSRPVLGS